MPAPDKRCVAMADRFECEWPAGRGRHLNRPRGSRRPAEQRRGACSMIERRGWQCPRCRRKWQIPATALNPRQCPKCEREAGQGTPTIAAKKSSSNPAPTAADDAERFFDSLISEPPAIHSTPTGRGGPIQKSKYGGRLLAAVAIASVVLSIALILLTASQYLTASYPGQQTRDNSRSPDGPLQALLPNELSALLGEQKATAANGT